MMVIGVGNEFRRDDGAGLAVVARLRDRVPPGVELVLTDGEPPEPTPGRQTPLGSQDQPGLGPGLPARVVRRVEGGPSP